MGNPPLSRRPQFAGNVVLADHGATIREEPLVPPVVPANGAIARARAHGR